jgi:hypothetical protein
VPEDAPIYALALGLAVVLLGLVLFVRVHPAGQAASPPPAAGLATVGLPPPDAEEALIGRVATVVATGARSAGTAARSTCTRAPAGGRANPATIARFCFDCVDEQPRGRASGAASASCVS